METFNYEEFVQFMDDNFWTLPWKLSKFLALRKKIDGVVCYDITAYIRSGLSDFCDVVHVGVVDSQTYRKLVHDFYIYLYQVR